MLPFKEALQSSLSKRREELVTGPEYRPEDWNKNLQWAGERAEEFAREFGSIQEYMEMLQEFSQNLTTPQGPSLPGRGRFRDARDKAIRAFAAGAVLADVVDGVPLAEEFERMYGQKFAALGAEVGEMALRLKRSGFYKTIRNYDLKAIEVLDNLFLRYCSVQRIEL